MVAETRCGLLELPAELRIRVYEECLAPTGTLCLTATKTNRYGTIPQLAPKLLCTCRQVYTEAQDILHQQNRVCFFIDAHDTQWPVVSEKRLPQHVLERLEHVAIVLDTATTFYSTYKLIDWAALSALVSLKTLQISIVWAQDLADSGPASWMDFYDLLEEVLQRIPRSTTITYGTKEGSPERAFLESVAERRQRGRVGTERRSVGAGTNPVKVLELTTAEYAELAEVVGDVTQGAQSGGIDDVFADYRDVRVSIFSRTRVQRQAKSPNAGA